MGLSIEQRKAQARELCVREYGIDPETISAERQAWLCQGTSASMTLKDFATMAGVTVERCDKEWGGTFAYKTADNPSCTYCGHRTEAELYRAWAEETFGKAAFKALSKLLSA